MLYFSGSLISAGEGSIGVRREREKEDGPQLRAQNM